MQENYLKRDQFQAILDSRPKGMPMQTAIDMYVKNGFIIEGINDQKKPKISALESSLAGVGEGVGGIALSAIQKGGEALVEKFGTEQMKQNIAKAPTLRDQYRQTFGSEENPLAYSAGEFGGQVASLAAPAAAVGRLAKVGVESVGAGQKTAKLTQAGTEGLAFTAGQGLQSGEEQTLSDYVVNAGLNIAVPGVGMVAKSASENLAPRIINSLIKPLAKDFSYGKNPGKSVAELVPPSNSFEGLISNISSTLDDVGSRIGSVVNQSQTLKQIDLSYTLNALDEAIKNAYKTPRTNQSLIGRLESVKSDLADNINNGIDPQAYKQLIGDLTKWTGNASDDEIVNKALKQTYGSTRNLMDESLKKELTPKQFNQYKADSEAYGNLLSAKNAAIYRDKINERQNIISFGAKNAGLLTGLTAAVASGGAGIPAILAGLAGAGIDKALASTAFKTRMASLLTKLAPKDVKTFFETVPTAKTIFTEDEIKNFTGELKKNTKLNRGMIDFDAEVLPKKTVSSLEQEAKKYKTAEEFVKAKSGNQGIYDKTYDEMIQKNRAGAKPFDYELMELLDAIPETKDGNVKIYRATTNGEILPGDNVSIYDMKQYVDPNNRGLNITAAKMGVTKLSGNKDIKFVEKWIPKEDLYQTDAGTQLYAPNGMKSLTDIWNKANKK